MRNSVHLLIVHVLQLLPVSLVQEVGNSFLLAEVGYDLVLIGAYH